MLEKEYNEKETSYYLHARLEMLKYIPSDATIILDVGCSSGEFGNAIKKKLNCIVWGIEPDKQSSERADLVLDKVFNGFFEDGVNFFGQKFDCIIFNDVLEHLPNPFEALNLCKSFLKKNGVIVASIPNIRFFDAMYHIILQKDFQYTNAGIFDKTHLRFFTKKSTQRMFIESGYQIKALDGINSIKEINIKGYRNFKILNTLLFNFLEDMEYQQYAVVAAV
ncbi:class I SAM-dependent methyltransferase [Spirosoma terrae]|uniref:Class I SAM-dependent methyltransferase n=1 Tax=Spirosoma terrae TaxID=1968276 RepID=A0A6L9LHD6_9BACT|nr:class I SAM-dependent methyltransferase [Spirosoma terrae]NDU97998.1 class I SAM-dependent methyltransferase [Spirosoma terrae]